VLGEDADLFATSNNQTSNAATVEEEHGDLLGDDFAGDTGATNAGELNSFESSFPAIDTQNEVRQAIMIRLRG
jgi:hypothetical protein